MNELKPKLFDCLKGYNTSQLIKDIISGIIVAIIALPLSIALAIASGVGPEQGLYTAIIAGFFIAFFGGSRVQIGGPTAAFVTIIYGIVTTYGTDGLIVATIMAGIFLIVMGVLKFGSLIKYIPFTITTGFTCGIAVTLFVGQLKDFFGLSIEKVPSEFLDKVWSYITHFGTVNIVATIIGLVAVAIMLVWPKITDKIPGSLIAIIVTTLIVKFANLTQVSTIGSVFGQLNSSFPAFHIPNVDFGMLSQLVQPAFTIAILAGIESLLSAVVADGMINDRHKSNAELVGQGLGNIFSGLFGGIPATGAIARTAANVRNGGRTPIAGITHCVTLTVILVALMPLAQLIPMTTLAAVLLVVAANMADWKSFIHLCKTAPKSDVIVLVVTFALTVIFDLVVAIEVGVVLASVLFMKRMSETADIQAWRYPEQVDNEEEAAKLMSVPKEIRVFEIIGPMFFAASDRLLEIDSKKFTKVMVLRMRSVPAIDASAMISLRKVVDGAKKKGITVVFSHVNEQPMSVMEKDHFIEYAGADNFRPNITAALEYAEELITKRNGENER